MLDIGHDKYIDAEGAYHSVYSCVGERNIYILVT